MAALKPGTVSGYRSHGPERRADAGATHPAHLGGSPMVRVPFQDKKPLGEPQPFHLKARVVSHVIQAAQQITAGKGRWRPYPQGHFGLPGSGPRPGLPRGAGPQPGLPRGAGPRPALPPGDKPRLALPPGTSVPPNAIQNNPSPNRKLPASPIQNSPRSPNTGRGPNPHAVQSNPGAGQQPQNHIQRMPGPAYGGALYNGGGGKLANAIGGVSQVPRKTGNQAILKKYTTPNGKPGSTGAEDSTG